MIHYVELPKDAIKFGHVWKKTDLLNNNLIDDRILLWLKEQGEMDKDWFFQLRFNCSSSAKHGESIVTYYVGFKLVEHCVEFKLRFY